MGVGWLLVVGCCLSLFLVAVGCCWLVRWLLCFTHSSSLFAPRRCCCRTLAPPCAAGVLFSALTTKTMNNDVGGDMKSFMRLYRTIGGVWFVCMPLFVFVAEFFAQYLRHPIITGGTLIIQSSTLCMMAWLFVGSKNTLYFKRSTVGATTSGGLGGMGGLGVAAGLDSGTKTTFKLMGSNVRAHCD